LSYTSLIVRQNLKVSWWIPRCKHYTCSATLVYMQLYEYLINLPFYRDHRVHFFLQVLFHNVIVANTGPAVRIPIKWCVTWSCMQFPISSRLCMRDSQFRKSSSRSGRGSTKQRERAKNARDKSHVHELNKRCFPLASNSRVENCR